MEEETPFYEFSSKDYDRETNIITIPMGKAYPFIKYSREHNRALLPMVKVKSVTGKVMEFINPKEFIGGMWYQNGNIKLRLEDGLKG